MKFKLLLAATGAAFLLTACEDLFEDGSLQPDGSKPTLTIRNPTKNQSLTKSGGLRIRLTATDKDKIKELQVRVRDVGGDADQINFTTIPDRKILEMDTVISTSELRSGNYTLTINAVDYRTNVASGEVAFTIK